MRRRPTLGDRDRRPFLLRLQRGMIGWRLINWRLSNRRWFGRKGFSRSMFSRSLLSLSLFKSIVNSDFRPDF